MHQSIIIMCSGGGLDTLKSLDHPVHMAATTDGAYISKAGTTWNRWLLCALETSNDQKGSQH